MSRVTSWAPPMTMRVHLERTMKRSPATGITTTRPSRIAGTIRRESPGSDPDRFAFPASRHPSAPLHGHGSLGLARPRRLFSRRDPKRCRDAERTASPRAVTLFVASTCPIRQVTPRNRTPTVSGPHSAPLGVGRPGPGCARQIGRARQDHDPARTTSVSHFASGKNLPFGYQFPALTRSHSLPMAPPNKRIPVRVGRGVAGPRAARPDRRRGKPRNG